MTAHANIAKENEYGATTNVCKLLELSRTYVHKLVKAGKSSTPNKAGPVAGAAQDPMGPLRYFRVRGPV